MHAFWRTAGTGRRATDTGWRAHGVTRGVRAFAACLTFLLIATAASADDPAAANVAFFEERIRPVLVEHCHECHGPGKQEAGLRLDSRTAVLKGSDNGPVVTERQPDQSLLVEAIRRGGDVEMPPDDPLDAEQVASIEEWIRRGLPWPADAAPLAQAPDPTQHWAFQPISHPPPPAVADRDWPLNDIDRFVLAKLEAHRIRPAPPADRRTLLRRASFTLLGLPPEPDDVDVFLADESPAAFDRLIDRLLASPHYGERWGRHWLDVARYADNKGYVFFEEQKYPWAYTYRDYVVESLNADLSYDRFIIEQLAADQLEGPDDSASSATASAADDPGTGETQFGGSSATASIDISPALRALGFLTVGGHFINNVHDIQDDRIDVVTRGLMGLTLTCARCHDHKYDPLSQADYYALYGVFRSTYEPLVPPLYESPPDTDEFRQFDAELHKRLEALDVFVHKKHQELVDSARQRVAEYLIEAHNTRDQPSTEGFMLLIDPGDLHPSAILRWWVHLDRTKRAFDPIWSVWHAFAALPTETFPQEAETLCQALRNRDPADPHLNPYVVAALTDPPPQSMQEVATRLAALLHDTDRQWLELLQSAAANGSTTPVSFPDSDREELRLVFYGDEAPANIPLEFGWGFITLIPDRPSQGEFEKLLKEVEQWSMTAPGAPPRAMVLLDAERPFEPRVFVRGNPDRAGDSVARRFPHVLDGGDTPFDTGSGRLELAQKIASPDNPLTARVIVNRVWMHHFGEGLVRTPGDFGLRSEPPTHPELLDWLASEFISHGWSLKWLHREIMSSAMWQQGATSDARGPESDPENRFLSQRPARRLDFESTRDSLLAVSGLLDDSLGGQSVDLFTDPTPPRRTLYGFVNRLDMPNLLRTFDVPASDATSPQRDTTTVASQALFLMNGPWTYHAAVNLLQRSEFSGQSDPAMRLDQIHQTILSRPPTDDERTLALQFLGESPTEESWTELVQALLMSNEFVFVD